MLNRFISWFYLSSLLSLLFISSAFSLEKLSFEEIHPYQNENASQILLRRLSDLPEKKVKSIDLGSFQITPEIVDELVKFSGIEELDLQGAVLSEDSFIRLMHSSALSDLRSLNLCNIQIIKKNQKEKFRRDIWYKFQADASFLAQRLPHFHQLKKLNLLGTGDMDLEGFKKLCEIYWISQLEDVNLLQVRVNGIDLAESELLFDLIRRLPQLTRLDVNLVKIPVDFFAAMIAKLPNLEILNLDGRDSHTGDEVIPYILKLRHLKELSLGRVKVTAHGIQSLLDSFLPAQLERFTTETPLAENQIITILTRMPRLKWLYLGFGKDAPIEGIPQAISQGIQLENLEGLVISASNADAIGPLLQYIPALKTLLLSETGLTSAIIPEMEKANFAHLETLDLHRNFDFNSDQLVPLLERMPKLRNLQLNGTGLTLRGAELLSKSSVLDQLHYLDLRGTYATTPAATYFKYFINQKLGEPRYWIGLPATFVYRKYVQSKFKKHPIRYFRWDKF